MKARAAAVDALGLAVLLVVSCTIVLGTAPSATAGPNLPKPSEVLPTLPGAPNLTSLVPPPPPPVPPLPPPPPRNPGNGVAKPNRALIVVSAGLERWGDPHFRLLYKFLAENGARAAKDKLSPLYDKVEVLDRGRGTLQRFYETLADLSRRYQAVDVIIHAHGARRQLWFEDCAVDVDELGYTAQHGTPLRVIAGDDASRSWVLNLPAIPLTSRNHLRALYSTACYASTHFGGWDRMGFDIASGAIGVSADSIASFPTFLNYWAAGYNFGDAVDAANRSDPQRAYDQWARVLGFSDVNSQRQTWGLRGTTIASVAQPRGW
jgi:hypothetical protein